MSALKKKKYANGLLNGDFEDEDSEGQYIKDWILDISNMVNSLDNTRKYHGSFSQKLQSTAGSNFIYQYAREGFVVSNHIYYAFIFFYKQTSGIGAMAIDSLAWDNWVDGSSVSISNQWGKSSDIFTGRNGCIFCVWNTASIVNVDCAGLIDLTLEFGAGNEPTKEWCDNNIDLIISNIQWNGV